MPNVTSGFFTWLDRSVEKSTMSFRLPDIGDDGLGYPGLLTDIPLLKAALEGVTEGAIVEGAIVADRTRYTNITPSTGQRESKWLVRYEDSTTKKVYTWEIPCADDAAMPFATGSDFVDMDSASATRDALITELEKLLSPVGNAVTVISIERVGRNT